MEIRVVQSNKNVAICTTHQAISITEEQATALVAALVATFGTVILPDDEEALDLMAEGATEGLLKVLKREAEEYKNRGNVE